MNHEQTADTTASPTTGLSPITSADLRLPGLRHAFFTRSGGVSDGIYKGLNVGIGSNDERAKVMENRRRAAEYLGAPEHLLVNPYQVHSPDVVTVSGPFEGDRPKADAIVTATPGVAIGVVTADCGPILFADPQARVIGAAHAGWKGAIGGVLESTIAAMERLRATRANIKAVLGPSISQKNYEVGPEFVAQFTAHDPQNARWFAPSVKAGHSMFDLWGYTLERLAKAGVSASVTGHCTYADEDRFFSYRRTTHRAEPDYGRQLSALMLTE